MTQTHEFRPDARDERGGYLFNNGFDDLLHVARVKMWIAFRHAAREIGL
jgi:hypothetical protein